MDGQRFDTLVKTVCTRRSALGLVAGIGVVLGVRHDEAAARKCKKKCGPCKRCKKGKCKPKRGAPRCGPCSFCEGGACRALCPPEECVDSGGEDVCLRDCDPPCDTCSDCNRVQGQCEPICTQDECINGFCHVPCETPCGECSVCDFGECFDLCESEQCIAGRCGFPCSPDCAADEDCVGGECFPVCTPPCEDDQGCVAVGGEHTCVDLVGTCADEDHVCFTASATMCTASGRSGRCVNLPGGASYCAQGISCSLCGSDVDCQSQGFGPNSRCVADCEFCFGSGGVGCVSFAADQD